MSLEPQLDRWQRIVMYIQARGGLEGRKGLGPANIWYFRRNFGKTITPTVGVTKLLCMHQFTNFACLWHHYRFWWAGYVPLTSNLYRVATLQVARDLLKAENDHFDIVYSILAVLIMFSFLGAWCVYTCGCFLRSNVSPNLNGVMQL